MALALTGCAEQWDDLQPTGAQADAETISFSATVVPPQGVTRADATIVNKNEHELTPTGTDGPRVGVFGYVTGTQTWDEMTDPKPSADLFYNVPLQIDASTDGSTNLLHYTDKRFWPNGHDGTDRVSFWAYYPYNPTHLSGELGIDFDASPDFIGEGTGRGKLRFRMNRDASKNVDLLVSDLVKDCSKATYPLLTNDGGATYTPSRVNFLFRHLLAQVRVYANIFGRDRVVWITHTEGTGDEAHEVTTLVSSGDGYEGKSYIDAYGNTKTLAVGDSIPDDFGWDAMTPEQKAQVQTVRWKRTVPEQLNIRGYPLAEASMRVAFHNLRSQGTFTLTPVFNPDVHAMVYPCALSGKLDSVYVDNYEQNPLWFMYEAWDVNKMHPKLNEAYMYGDSNYAAHNIFLVLPQQLRDSDVPYITIAFYGEDRQRGGNLWARVTVNMLNLNINWESGFIYSYAFVEELMPGEDKVLGPESITVGYDPDLITDQW